MIRHFTLTLLIAAALPAAASVVVDERHQPAKNESPATASDEANQDEKDWAFDQSLYTNSPKTGKRVLQYEKKKRAYRDPNSFFDSPHEAYPFVPDPLFSPYYIPYPYSPPYYPGPYHYYGPYAPPYPYPPVY